MVLFTTPTSSLASNASWRGCLIDISPPHHHHSLPRFKSELEGCSIDPPQHHIPLTSDVESFTTSPPRHHHSPPSLQMQVRGGVLIDPPHYHYIPLSRFRCKLEGDYDPSSLASNASWRGHSRLHHHLFPLPCFKCELEGVLTHTTPSPSLASNTSQRGCVN